MNIIEPGLVLDPNTTRLVHCKACDTTWADKKIPKMCPHCGAVKGKLETAKDAECESFMEAYSEMLEASSEDSSDREEYGGESLEGPGVENTSIEIEMDSSADQTTASYDDYEETDTYEPIGYDPDDFANNMIQNAKVSNLVKKELIAGAEQKVRETKWALQRCGLPTDALQSVTQDVKQQADKLGKNIPGYVDLMLKMVVDNTIQRELRHPRKNRSYSVHDVAEMLSELEIRESCWDSYYAVAGLAG